MARRMTIVFDDEQLYTTLKVEAARTHRPAKDIVAEALLLLFEATGDERDAIFARLRAPELAPRREVDRVLEELGLSQTNVPASKSRVLGSQF